MFTLPLSLRHPPNPHPQPTLPPPSPKTSMDALKQAFNNTDPSPSQTSGQEPVSGDQGKGTASEPFDQGNAEGEIPRAYEAGVGIDVYVYVYRERRGAAAGGGKRGYDGGAGGYEEDGGGADGDVRWGGEREGEDEEWREFMYGGLCDMMREGVFKGCVGGGRQRT